MELEATFDIIKSTVHSFLPNAKVLLFGSRARKDHSRHTFTTGDNSTLISMLGFDDSIP